MKKTGYISMKKRDIDLNFFFDLWRIKISTTYKKPHISKFNIFLSNSEKTDQNYPKILEIWQHAVILLFPPGVRTYRNHILSLGHL